MDFALFNHSNFLGHTKKLLAKHLQEISQLLRIMPGDICKPSRSSMALFATLATDFICITAYFFPFKIVVAHDNNLQRVCGKDINISDLKYEVSSGLNAVS